MNPVKFKEVNIMCAEDQEEYITLPAYQNEEESISCWKFTWLERVKILLFGRLWLRQMNFGSPLQPQLPQIESPFISSVRKYPNIGKAFAKLREASGNHWDNIDPDKFVQELRED